MKLLKIRYLTLAFALLTALHGTVCAQAVAAFEADTIALGDQTILSIRNALNYPSTDMLSGNGIVALSQSFDTASHTQFTLITSFEPGEHYLRLGPDDSLLLVVTDVEVDTTSTEIRDIAAIEKVPYSFWEIFRWVLLALGIAAVALLVWWLLTHRQKLQEVLGTAAPVDTRTPEERALQGLEALRRKQLWQAGKVKEYHTELTDLVRCFVEEATGIRATDMTSDETVEAVGAEWPDVARQLRDIFTTADLVKFAKSEPLPYEHDHALGAAVEAVKALWQEVKPADEEAAEKHE